MKNENFIKYPDNPEILARLKAKYRQYEIRTGGGDYDAAKKWILGQLLNLKSDERLEYMETQHQFNVARYRQAIQADKETTGVAVSLSEFGAAWRLIRRYANAEIKIGN